jgi:hypothetical protein
VQAVFKEILTTNHATPLWWLASCGYTQDWETAVSLIGSNDLPLWQSYIAGLNPNDPDSQLGLSMLSFAAGQPVVLQWQTVTGRLYTVLTSTNAFTGFRAIPSAVDLPASIASLTNASDPVPARFYRLEVRLP